MILSFKRSAGLTHYMAQWCGGLALRVAELRDARNTNTVERAMAGRNDPCPCGSGKKYKRCCLGKADSVAPVEKLSPLFRFEPGSYGRLGAFVPSIACLKQVRPDEWEYHFVIVRPETVHDEEESAVAEATRDLNRAFAGHSRRVGDLAVAHSLKGAGYVSVDGFQVVQT